MCAEILFLRGCALRKLRAASGDLDARNFAMRPERKGLGAGDSGLWRGIRVGGVVGHAILPDPE